MQSSQLPFSSMLDTLSRLQSMPSMGCDELWRQSSQCIDRKRLPNTKYEPKVLNPRYVIPFFSDRLKYVPSIKEQEKPFFVVGNVYTLSGVECEEFSMPSKDYELVAVLDNVNDIVLDSVVMKQIDGDKGTIFSLTRLDCKNLDIEFQRGLQIFPKNLNWVKKEIDNIEENVEKDIIFDSSILRTYPPSFDDGTIHRMVIKISNFEFNPTTKMVVAPDGTAIFHESFVKDRIHIKTKRQIGSACDTDSASFIENAPIGYVIRTHELSRLAPNSAYFDEEGSIFLELRLSRSSYGSHNEIGIKPEILGDASFEDLFEVIILGIKERKSAFDNDALHWHNYADFDLEPYETKKRTSVGNDYSDLISSVNRMMGENRDKLNRLSRVWENI